jgi:O-antigen ligase
MNSSGVVRDMGAGLEVSARSRRIPVSNVVLFLLFFLVGSLAILYASNVLGCFAVVGILLFGWLVLRYVRRADLDIWQVLLLVALTGYLLFNYGFENLTIHAGVPIIISYVLMFASLFLAAFTRPRLLMRAGTEPAMLCLWVLLFLTFLHLLLDVPSHGLWAIRDASQFLDGIFLALGLLWAMRRNSMVPLMKWLTIVFFLNLVYSLTLPLGEEITAWSPKSGVFIQVPLVGTYRGNAIFLLVGALFYMLLARYVVRWPRWIILFLAMAQLFGLAIHQARALYVALAVILIILFFLGEVGKAAKLLLLISPALAGILLLTTLGIEIEGRIGPVRTDFFKEHVRSLTGEKGTPGSGVEGRIEWYEQAFEHIRAHPVAGEGFGTVLIDFTNELTGGAVRQPHNSSVTVLARLGLVGLVPWVVLHLYVLTRFIYAFRQRRYCDKQLSDFIVWLFIVYVVFMIEASVEAAFEFPSAAIPCYFFVGLALGLIRWQVPQGKEKQLPRASMPEAYVV